MLAPDVDSNSLCHVVQASDFLELDSCRLRGAIMATQQPHHIKKVAPLHARGQEGVVSVAHHLVGVLVVRVRDEHEDFAL